MRWERGDITFLYRGEAASPEESLYVLDNQLRVYQKVWNIFSMCVALELESQIRTVTIAINFYPPFFIGTLRRVGNRI